MCAKKTVNPTTLEVYASLDFGSDIMAHGFLHDINIQELEWNIFCLVPQIKVNSWSAGHTHISCSCSASHKVELFVNHSHPPPLSLLTLHKADTLNTMVVGMAVKRCVCLKNIKNVSH